MIVVVINFVCSVLQLHLFLLPPAHMIPVIHGIVEMAIVFQLHIYVMVIMTVMITVMKITVLEVQEVQEVEMNQYQVSQCRIQLLSMFESIHAPHALAVHGCCGIAHWTFVLWLLLAYI